MNNSSLCDAAVYIAEDLSFKAVLLSRMILSLIGIILILALLRNQGPYLKFHKNARILLLSHHVSVLLQGVATIALHGADLLLFLTYEHPCDLLITGRRCQLLRYPVTITYYATIWTQFMMAIERTVATRLFRSYEQTGAKLGIVLIILQWILPFITLSIMVYDSDPSVLLSYCAIANKYNKLRVSFVSFFLATTEIVALAIFYCIMFINQRKRKKLPYAPLTEKYQLDENVRATQLMIPMVWMHFLFFFVPLCFFAIYPAVKPDIDPRNYPFLMETMSWQPIYCVLLPLLLFWRKKVVRGSQEALLEKISSYQSDALETRTDGRTQEQIRHFEMLKAMWNLK